MKLKVFSKKKIILLICHVWIFILIVVPEISLRLEFLAPNFLEKRILT